MREKSVSSLRIMTCWSGQKLERGACYNKKLIIFQFEGILLSTENTWFRKIQLSSPTNRAAEKFPAYFESLWQVWIEIMQNSRIDRISVSRINIEVTASALEKMQSTATWTMLQNPPQLACKSLYHSTYKQIRDKQTSTEHCLWSRKSKYQSWSLRDGYIVLQQR